MKTKIEMAIEAHTDNMAREIARVQKQLEMALTKHAANRARKEQLFEKKMSLLSKSPGEFAANRAEYESVSASMTQAEYLEEYWYRDVIRYDAMIRAYEVAARDLADYLRLFLSEAE